MQKRELEEEMRVDLGEYNALLLRNIRRLTELAANNALRLAYVNEKPEILKKLDEVRELVARTEYKCGYRYI